MTIAPPAAVAPIHTAFARFVSRTAASPQNGLVYHSALLASAERAEGNSCVDLSVHATRPALPGDDGEVVFPPLPEWQTRLLASGVCAASDQPAHGYAVTPLVLDGPRLYLRRYFDAERRLAAAIQARVSTPPPAHLAASAPQFRTLFPQASAGLDWQAVAAVAALRSSLVFVTGGPGTGKTTVAARLLALLLDRDPTLDIAVAAPTGRAAARLTEAIGAAVQRERLSSLVEGQLPTTGNTLHRLLGYRPWDERFVHHAGNPMPHDVVIVDEASMVDVLMMDALFAALRPSARLIVLGDPDQLASVDTGYVLGDVARAAREAGGAHPDRHGPSLAADYAMLSGGDAAWFEGNAHAGALRDAVVRLRVSYRFGARPGIGRLASATQEGQADDVLAVLANAAHADVALDPWPAPAGTAQGGTVPRASAPTVHMAQLLLHPLLPHVEAYLAAHDPARALAALARFRLLCALREGDTGVSGLNSLVEQWLEARGLVTGGWYDHRPVLITANDAGLRLFNGDVGVTLSVNGVPMVHFPQPDGTVRSLPPSRLPAHETAWAMTVHKSQGSEFDHVRLVLPVTDNRLVTRELLYTGITRAKESVSIVGSADLVRLAVQRSVVRASGLTARLATGHDQPGDAR